LLKKRIRDDKRKAHQRDDDDNDAESFLDETQRFDSTTALTNSSGFYGLICRIQKDGSFYYFIVQNNGVFAIGKIKDEVLHPLVEWTANNAIRQGNQTNRLRADCDGSALRFYVNDVFLGEANDSDFTSGYSGLIANALDTQGFEVVFNNFQITEPNQ